MFERSLAIICRPSALLLLLAGLAVSGVAVADSDLKKAYHGSNCDAASSGGEWIKDAWGFIVGEDTVMTIHCPIDRDGTQVHKLPKVVIEAYNEEVPTNGV